MFWTEETLVQHHEALQRLARGALSGEGALRAACRVATEVLDVERVSVWLFGPGRTEITCEVLFERSSSRYSKGVVLSQADYPQYFEALRVERTIAASDAHTDPQTCEFSAGYLEPLGIGALLDAPVLIRAESVGVVCHEHVGGVRHWLPSERLFAGAIADFVALALQASQLEESRDELALALDAANMGVWAWDVASGKVTWDERVGPLFGKPKGWAPSDFSDYMTLVHPSDREPLEQAIRVALEPGQQGYLVQHRVVLGGVQVRWLEGRGRVYRSADGAPLRMRGTVMDVTDRQRLEEQLLQAQKMEAVGRLAGGVAHDFNNLLTAITGTADLLRMDLGEDSPAALDLTQISQAAERGGALTRQLLTVARRQQSHPVAIDVNELLRDLDGLLRRVLGEDLELVLDLSDEPMIVAIDPGQLDQVVLNLAVNARDAMPDGGRLLVTTSRVIEAPGTNVVVEVRDTGLGMTEAVRLRAFEPFFTTKDRGRGTGLGLATCYAIVEQAGGSIQLQSELGEGTCVRVSVPEAVGATAQRPIKTDAPPSAQAETVLVVEDEPVVRRVVTRTLSSLGYVVLAAAGVAEGRALGLSQRAPLDLLITDVVMPHGSGPSLAAELRERGLVRRTLLISGYSFDLLDPALPADTYFLAKPFTVEQLGRRVHEILNFGPAIAANGSCE